MCCIFFFFKQKTAYEMRISDWSSDVCSSDLPLDGAKQKIHQSFTGGEAPELQRAAEVPARWGDSEVTHHSFFQLAQNAVRQPNRTQIGRASCRERVCQYV